MCGIPLFELKKCAKEWKEVFKGMIFGAKKAPFESELKYNTRRNSQNPPILPDSLRERRHPQGGVRVAQWADVRYFDYGEMPSATSCLESEPELLAEAPPRGVKRRKGRRATPIDI